MIKNLYELYNLIEKVSTALPNVNQFVNSFDSLNREDTSYAAVVLQFRDGTQATEGTVRYRFYLGYVDRVNENTDTPSTSNNILTQSIAEENIRLIINKLYPEVDITFGNTFYPFTQRFTALTAGCYVELAITLAVKDCNYESGSVLRDVEIVSDSNGVKEVVPGAGVDGFKKVIVRTEVPSFDAVQYFYKKPTADAAGLKAIGWTDDDVNYYKYNNYVYPWEADNYKVSDVNKQITINSKSDIATYKNNPDFKYCPMFDTSTESSVFNMFSYCKSLASIPHLDTSKATDMRSMFNTCLSLITIPQLDTRSATNMSVMFSGCSFLTTIPLLDTHNVTNMSYMFRDCSSLTAIPQLDTRSVTNMSGMFVGCEHLTTIPQLNTSKVTEMGQMFYNCSFLTTIPLLDTHSVTDMSDMFSGCSHLTTIPQLDTHSVINMNEMFSGCTSIISIPKLDATSLINAQYMFGYDWISLDNFTDFSGLTNLKVDLNLSPCPNLTKESLLNVFNEAADVTSSPKTLTLGETNLNKLTAEEKAIATNKGWTLA